MISIIIPVKNDRHIEKTLDRLLKIPKSEKTEILVIDASEGNLDDIKKKFPKVRWIYFHNKADKKYTFTEQINLGLKNTRGDLIALIDADCIPTKNWLIELVNPIRKEGEDYVTGKIKPITGSSVYDNTWKDLDKIKYRDEAGSANSIFKKELLVKVGLYDERFEAGSDVDFSWRARKEGYKIRYNKKAIIFDYWGGLKQDIKRGFRYGEARAKLYKKHPKMWKNLFRYDRGALAYPAYILLLPLTFFWHYYPLLIILPLIKEIKRNPFKVVSINLIFGLGILKELIFSKK